jgi:hypothetical protein
MVDNVVQIPGEEFHSSSEIQQHLHAEPQCADGAAQQALHGKSFGQSVDDSGDVQLSFTHLFGQSPV